MKMRSNFVNLATAVLYLLTAGRCEVVQPVVVSRYGQLRGFRTSMGDNSYVDTFLSIPYARPPTGELRFRPSQPPVAWTGIRDATAFGSQCPQPPWPFGSPLQVTYPNSEDCLQLSVYTPKVSSNRERLPVMVWAHGGWWVGTGNTFNGTQLAARGVVVVTINFRLSTLGFLSTEDGASPGNYGLWDMIRALEWVRDSISAFNGDPSDVTIFGESAGSVLTSLLVNSHAARGLFHKAIMQSGCSLSSYALGHPRLDPKPKEQARKLAEILGCDIKESDRMVACLRTKDAMAIVNATDQIRSAKEFSVPFRPVAETTFGQYGIFSAVPMAIMQEGLFSNVSTIRGFTKSESAGSVAFRDQENDGLTMEEFTNLTHDLVQEFAQSTIHVDLAEIERQVIHAYVSQPRITDPYDLRAAYLQMLDDYDMIAPTIHELQLVTQFPVRPQYLYRFSYRSPKSFTPSWAGAQHAEDVLYVFGAPVENKTIETLQFVSGWTEEDAHVSENVMTLWTNFAKYGDPTPDGLDGVRWLPWTQAAPTFLDLDLPLAVRDTQEVITPKVRFWIDTIPKILGENNPATLVG